MLVALLFSFVILVNAQICPKNTTRAIFNPGICYYFVNLTEQYSYAEKECQFFYSNAHLIKTRNIIDDTSICQIVYEHFEPRPPVDFWFGLHKGGNGEWTWMDGSELEYPNWGPNEPENTTGYDCAAMGVDDSKWYADNCDIYKPFLCALPSYHPS